MLASRFCDPSLCTPHYSQRIDLLATQVLIAPEMFLPNPLRQPSTATSPINGGGKTTCDRHAPHLLGGRSVRSVALRMRL
jgi:hypothetical protein